MRSSIFYGLLMLATVALLNGSQPSRAQKPLRFGKEEVQLEANVKRGCRLSRKKVDYGAAYGGKQNVLIELKRIPDSADRAGLRALGVELKGYVGGQAAYYAQIPQGLQPYALTKTSARAMVPIVPRWKVADALLENKIPDWAQRGAGQVAVTVWWFDNVEASFVEQYLASTGWYTESKAPTLRVITIVLPQQRVLELASQGWVQSINLVSPPMELFSEPSVMPSDGEDTLPRLRQQHERE